MRLRTFTTLLLLGLMAWVDPQWFGRSSVGSEDAPLLVEPSSITLRGSRDGAQALAFEPTTGGENRDLGRLVQWSSEDDSIARVESGGWIRPGSRAGTTRIIARRDSVTASLTVTVEEPTRISPPSFLREVVPALTKAGCNSGGCHGTPTGKNGFRLSLRGFDTALDTFTLTREHAARRVNLVDPDSSLLLLKGMGLVDHGGGHQLAPEGLPARILHDWIASGASVERVAPAALAQLELTPTTGLVVGPDGSRQLRAWACYEDGSRKDVTRLARFSSSDESLAFVDAFGLVTRAERQGEVAILAQLEDKVAAATLIFLDPATSSGRAWSAPPENNFIDTLLFKKLRRLRLPVSPLADDATFLRRVHFDTIGLPPTPAEVTRFLADTSPDKRRRIIDELLRRREFVDFWALKWSDLLGCNQRFVGKKGAFVYHRWIRDQFAAEVPFDQFARTIVTAKGPNYQTPEAGFYRRIRDPQEAAESVSQVFLGVRLQCARCHNHVSERWTQDDYYGFAAFFARVRYKNGVQAHEIYNKEEAVYLATRGEVVQPRTGQTMQPKALGAAQAAVVADGTDRREALAEWMTARENPFFARATVNRVWAQLLGRGIVDPVDDLRASNPAVCEELLTALANDFVARGYSLKQVVRAILNSATYQLSTSTTPGNAWDDRYFSHAIPRLLTAEQMLDAVSAITEVQEQFSPLPLGMRAAQVPDGEWNHSFLRAFGQPLRSTACQCERATDTTLEQALQLVGGKVIHAKLIAENNRLGHLLASGVGDDSVVRELFLAALGREPSEPEQELARKAMVATSNRRRCAEDLLWSLLNHPEFLFQH